MTDTKKKIRLMPQKDSITAYLDRTEVTKIDIPCESCGVMCCLEQEAYLETAIDRHEFTFLCVKCSPEPITTTQDLVAFENSQGRTITLGEREIDKLISGGNGSPEIRQQIFRSIARSSLLGVKVTPGKHIQELLEATQAILMEVPEELRDQSWVEIQTTGKRLLQLFEIKNGLTAIRDQIASGDVNISDMQTQKLIEIRDAMEKIRDAAERVKQIGMKFKDEGIGTDDD